jgi:hypothetical protein
LPESRGDVVAFYPLSNRFYPERMFFVKKAVGLPGDEVSRIGRRIVRIKMLSAETKGCSCGILVP